MIRLNKPLAQRALSQATDQRPRFLILNPSPVRPSLTLGESVLLTGTTGNICTVVRLRTIAFRVPRVSSVPGGDVDLSSSCGSQRYEVINYRDTMRSKPNGGKGAL